MSADVVVVDYGMGNLFSVRRAFEHCGARVAISGDPGVLSAAPRLVLPGVGAFADGMRGLIERGLATPVVDYAGTGRPLLGICLGMQMLAGASEEFGEHRGLDIIPGRVVRLPRADPHAQPWKAPFVGWADLQPGARPSAWEDSILQGLTPGDAVYLTHSFAVRPDDASHTLAHYRYHGVAVTAAVLKGNVCGVQFHPEKSGAVGLRIIANFIKLG